MAWKETSKEIAEAIVLRTTQPQPIKAADFYRWSLMGLAAILREVDSMSYKLHELEKRGVLK